MSGKRTARLNEQFKREISEILHREVRDPRIGRPTVTAVEATPDLWMARVFVRPAPGEGGEEREADLLAGLEAAVPFVRRELGERLILRRIPELRFELDHALDHAMRIERILREVLPSDREKGTAADDVDDASREPGESGTGEGGEVEGDEARGGRG